MGQGDLRLTKSGCTIFLIYLECSWNRYLRYPSQLQTLSHDFSGQPGLWAVIEAETT